MRILNHPPRCIRLSSTVIIAYAALSSINNAVAQVDLCTWYPGTPECRCQDNPFDVVCATVQSQPPPWETYRDEVPPPPLSDGMWILPLASAPNPISATCTSSPEVRYHYAYYAILNRWYNGDVEYMETNEWHDTGYTFNVVFPNGTSFETYHLTRRGGASNINVIAPWEYESVQCWAPNIPTG
jgi:hypothetical protein